MHIRKAFNRPSNPREMFTTNSMPPTTISIPLLPTSRPNPLHARPLPPPLRALPPELQPYLIPEPESPFVQTLKSIPVLPLQVALTSIAAYLAAAWPVRPRGWSRTDLIEVRDSPVQGKGIFTKTDIPPDTVLGAYPGRPRSPTDMTLKCEAAPLAQYYCFKNKHGRLLDPTDWTGAPSTTPVPGLPWLPVDITLSFANEPPKGSPGVNVTVDDDPKDDEGLIFVSIVRIPAGAEIFVDYGLDYDRSGYGRK